MAVGMKMAAFWVVALCSLIEVYWYSELLPRHPGDRGSKHLWNINKLLPDCMPQQCRRQPFFISKNVPFLSIFLTLIEQCSNKITFRHALSKFSPICTATSCFLLIHFTCTSFQFLSDHLKPFPNNPSNLKMVFKCNEGSLSLHPDPRLGVHILLGICNWLFNICTATHWIWKLFVSSAFHANSFPFSTVSNCLLNEKLYTCELDVCMFVAPLGATECSLCHRGSYESWAEGLLAWV
jgi:hypothetical protein